MQEATRIGSITGALTGLTLSLIHMLPLDVPTTLIDLLFFAIISFMSGGIGGAVGGWLGKYLRPEKDFIDSIKFGFVGGVLAYIILVIVVMLYFLSHPIYYP